jgi:pimeloyl-ACP methyl ester carboxylesterase
MPTTQIDAATINYELSGEGPLVVLLHEIGGTRETWAPLAALLRGFHTLRYDQRGAGTSSHIAGPFSLDTQVDDISALLDALGERGPVHLAGVAIGAAFAIRCAVQNPQRVKSLVLACPAPGVDAARIDYLKIRADAVEREGMTATVENSLANSYPPEVRRDPEAFAAYRARFLANDPKSYAAINRAFADFDVTPDLPNIKCPALVLAGTHDKLRPPAFVRGIADKIPGARYAEIDSGHIMPVQAPQALSSAMTNFYAAVDG